MRPYYWCILCSVNPDHDGECSVIVRKGDPRLSPPDDDTDDES